MKILNALIPPPIVAFLFGCLSWLIAKFTLHVEVDQAWRAAVSALLVACALTIDISAIVSFRKWHTTLNPLKPDAASVLVQSGIFQYSRNPMYLGLGVLLLALTVYLSAPVTLASVCGFILFIQKFQILPEEHAMEKQFGDAYRRYKAKVRRWL